MFYIPADTCKSVGAGNLPPGTGYYAVEIVQFEDRGVLDKQGNYSYFIHMKFDNGSTIRQIGSVPFDSDGELAPALRAMDEDTRNKKIGGMVAALKRVAISSGITEDYMAENGLPTEHLVGRTAYIAYLGRPTDTPRGVKAYGDVQDFLTKERYDKLADSGAVPEDTRQFHWRKNQGNTAAQERSNKMPPPPTSRGKLPPPPTR